MKLIDLIEYLIDRQKLNELYEKLKLNTDSEALIICMKDSLNVESDVFVFEIEDTEGRLSFDKNNIHYIELFPLEHAVDLIEFDLNLKGKGFTDLQIAKRLLDYRKNDA